MSLVVRLSITLSKEVGSEVIKNAPLAIGEEASGRRRVSKVSVELDLEVLAEDEEESGVVAEDASLVLWSKRSQSSSNCSM